MYEYNQKPGTRIADASAATVIAIRNSEYSVLVGRNNCGKSYLLKMMTQQWGQNASYLGPARYQNFSLLGFFTPNRNRKNEKWNQTVQQFSNNAQNIDNSPINLQQAIAELSDRKREILSEIMKILLDTKLDVRQTVEDNSMSQKYISCDGHNISYTSSGYRLITTLVTSLLDEDYDTFLIDEPELGISPEAQGVLADFLFNRAHRARYFAHIKTLVFATHSTIFLDRSQITNNYTVNKKGDEISVTQVKEQAEFNKIHFFLLGNRFETLYLPSVIVLVEGKTDFAFISVALEVCCPQAQISVVNANSDSRIKEILNTAKSLLTDIQRSPYRERIVVVLDSVHGRGLKESLMSMGLPEENIVIWDSNGIEHVYPKALLGQVFGAGDTIQIVGDRISRNGLEYSKAELCDKICRLVKSDTDFSGEFENKFLSRIRAIVS